MIFSDSVRSLGEKRNRLIEACDTQWVAFLDDDDTLFPHHIETLLSGTADVVVPHCRFAGPVIPRPDCCEGKYNRPFDRQHLNVHNLFPVTVLARREAVLDVGGFPTDRIGPEDWALWKKMNATGATFQVIPEVTWTYHTRGSGRMTGPSSFVNRAKQSTARRFPRMYRKFRSS